MNYKDAGVDIEAGNSFVDRIKSITQGISSLTSPPPEPFGGLGGFNGMMRVPSGYKSPVLVAGADGVGTKINLARLSGGMGHYHIGIDLVAMCVNDVITCGAEPLYFLDYIATEKIDEDVLTSVISGIVVGCGFAGCSLLGGETAEMPGMYDGGKYDLAGFCTGIVEEEDIIDGSRIKPGDKVLGIVSNGLHSNGFSLINKLNEEFFACQPMRDLSSPTTIYAPVVKQLKKEVDILGMAHITGGGIPGNLPRCLPDDIEVDIDYNSWPRPKIFDSIAKYGDVSEEEMRKVFNLGIGYCLVVPERDVLDAQRIISKNRLTSWVMGTCIQS